MTDSNSLRGRLTGGALLAGLALALCAGCGSKEAVVAPPKHPVVRVQKPQVKTVTDYKYYTGRTEAVDSVDLRARVTGYLWRWNFDKKSDEEPVKDYNFIPGQEVKRGQVLFKIDPRPYQATFDQASAQVVLAEAQLKLANADVARAREVAKTPGAISQQDVDKYVAAADKAAAEVEAQKANLESARLNLQFTDVLCPVDGIVSRNLLSVGNLVNADTTLLTTIVSQDPMYLYFDMDEPTLEQLMKLIREGKLKTVDEESDIKVNFALDVDGNNYPYEATFDFINNQIDPTTGTIQIRGVFKNPKPERGPRVFTPGMFTRVRVPIGEPHEAMLVPQKAIGTNQGERYLSIVTDENIVRLRPVKVGQQHGELQEIYPEKIVLTDDGNYRMASEGESGIDSVTPNDWIIVSGLQRARPGSQVEKREETNQ